MNNFSVSSCLLKEIENNKKLATGILNKICDDSTPYKVVVDRAGVILDLYNELGNQSQSVAVWISYLTKPPLQIEFVDIKLNKDDDEIIKFIETAAQIRNDKQLIVHSHNNIPSTISYEEGNIIEYKGNKIKVLNSGEAIDKFSIQTNVNIGKLSMDTKTKNKIKDSVVASDNSSVSKVNFKSSKKTISEQPLLIALIIGIISSLIASAIWYFFFKQ